MPKVEKGLNEVLVEAGVEKLKTRWNGPVVDGVSYSSLCKWITCRERFRLERVEGWVTVDKWSKPIGFGNMWHICEEYSVQGLDWKTRLKDYAKIECKKYPLDQEQIEKYYQICIRQFEVYLDYYKDEPFPEEAQEMKLRVKYPLPSGDFVILTGYIDGVEKTKNSLKVWENKTKGVINVEAISNRLLFDDFQAMLYCAALREEFKVCPEQIVYNVVRRPLSGGKGTIKQRKPTKSNPRGESTSEFYERLLNEYIKVEPSEYFRRFTLEVNPHTLNKFETECLQPILQQVVNWWKSIENDPFDPWNDSSYSTDGSKKPNPLHFRSPSGIYNPLAEGRYTDLDEFLMTGNPVGLRKKSD